MEPNDASCGNRVRMPKSYYVCNIPATAIYIFGNGRANRCLEITMHYVKQEFDIRNYSRRFAT